MASPWGISATTPRAEPKVYASGSDEGFLLFDKKGNILKHVRAGIRRRPALASIARICPVFSI